ncbi:MAG: transaldolase [Deltaproteobacteria bacterium]|nr:transaldolase [Deltaproteobacteria bacterium]
MSKNPNIAALNQLGQSIWYDNLSRDVLESGELEQLIASGVSGLTSNPTIFHKAISGSSLYDQDLKQLHSQGLTVEEITDKLMIADVASAARLLEPIYRATGGADGYASIEVSPLLAANTESTLNEARRIWSELDLPNIMIKVPATSEGLPAIEALIADGINVNVTLIFSPERYIEVVDAYLRGLERRKELGEPMQVASVASFFISRVDAIVEKAFEQKLQEGLVDHSKRDLIWGKIGIANSKIAYAQFEEIFGSARFAGLSEAGAWIQRPLWASTSTKNPDFPELLYVEELAGKDTVNTLPPATVTTLCKGATIEPRLHQGLDSAQQAVKHVQEMGISLSDLLVKLEEDGVRSFSESYHALNKAIADKCAQLEK